MELDLSNPDVLRLRKVPDFFAAMLKELPSLAAGESYSPEAECRLFPAPCNAEEHPEIDADWKAFVQPELHEFFRSARDVVEADLRGMRQSKNGARIDIPMRHADSWLNALNQARLSLAAAYNLTEKELSAEPESLGTDSRAQALARVNLFALLQEVLIRAMEGRQGGEPDSD